MTDPTPYSLRPKAAAAHFGIAKPTIYGWVSNGRLQRGKHYLKVGHRIVIIREAFIDFLHQEDIKDGGPDPEQPALS